MVDLRHHDLQAGEDGVVLALLLLLLVSAAVVVVVRWNGAGAAAGRHGAGAAAAGRHGHLQHRLAKHKEHELVVPVTEAREVGPCSELCYEAPYGSHRGISRHRAPMEDEALVGADELPLQHQMRGRGQSL